METPSASRPAVPDSGSTTVMTRYTEGLVAGILGATAVAVWFLVLDTIRGRPLSTPSLLGRAIFHGLEEASSPEAQPVSLEMVLTFTWIHGLVFCAIGGIAVWLLGMAERNPNYGFGIIALMILLACGFIFLCMIFAEPVLRALTWPAILVGNALAAASMGIFLWRRHPGISILP